jgi:hypothetical protein
MIVVGGKARGSRVLLSTAEYDPGADEWSTLPSVPARAHRIVALVASGAGSHVYVWNVWGSDATGAAGIDLLAYDATAQTWRAVPASPGAPRGVADAFWTGDELIVPPARPWPGDFGNLTVLPDLPGARYTPATHTWHGIPPGPLGDGVGRDVWTGGALVRLTNAIGGMSAPGAAVVWDPHSGAWLQLPRQSPVMSMSGDATVWTGRELLVWGDVMGADAVVGPPSSAPGTGGIRLRG